jgi:hypothetical protein
MREKPFLLSDLDALDPAALKAMICLQHAELVSHKSQIEHLELLIAKLRRMQFGRSSEKVERTRPGKAMVDGAGKPGIGYFAILAA